MYHSCYIKNTKMVLDLAAQLNLRTKEGQFGKQLVKCILVTENPLMYFRLYHHNPYPTFKIMMDNYNDTMRLRALQMLRKSYLSASMSWVGTWLGIYNDKRMLEYEVKRILPSCIKSVDIEREMISFAKHTKQ